MKSQLIHTPGVIATILESGLKMLMKEAEARGATCGVGGVGLLLEGRLYTRFAPLHDDWALAFDPDIQWPGETKKGINYFGFAAGKMAMSVRTHEPSTEYPITSLDFGESADPGNICRTLFLDDGTPFELHAVYSGFKTGDEDVPPAIESVLDMELASEKLLAA